MTIEHLTPAAAAREAEKQRRRYAFACAAADHATEAGARYRASLIRAKARRLQYEAKRLERMAQLRAFVSVAWEG